MGRRLRGAGKHIGGERPFRTGGVLVVLAGLAEMTQQPGGDTPGHRILEASMTWGHHSLGVNLNFSRCWAQLLPVCRTVRFYVT